MERPLEMALGRVEAVPPSDYPAGEVKSRHGSNIQMCGPVCELCGGPVTRSPRGRRRRQHPACTAFKAYLAAAARATQGITFADAEAAKGARRLVLGLANRLPVSWERPRDARGRFVPAREIGVK